MIAGRLGARRARTPSVTEAGTRLSAEQESGLKRFQARCGKRLMDTGANDARAAKERDAKRQRLQHAEPKQQEPSSGSGRNSSRPQETAPLLGKYEGQRGGVCW